MPGNFLTQPDADFTGSMDQVYFTSLWTARAAARRLLLSPPASSSSSSTIPPKLVFTASILSFMSFAGYSSYAPAKYALRGLADSLRNELQWLGVDVHTFFPTGIRSPGFEVEEARKPEICKTVEGSDLPISPMQCAQHLLAGASSSRVALQAGHSLFNADDLLREPTPPPGVEKGRYNITYDLAASIFRASSRGLAPYNNVPYDLLLAFIGSVRRPSLTALCCRHRYDCLLTRAPPVVPRLRPAVRRPHLAQVGRRAGPQAQDSARAREPGRPRRTRSHGGGIVKKRSSSCARAR
jgi:3-dehydrosphinganine reductase